MTRAARATIGLVDWGIGGLGIARKLNAPFLYFSDTGFAPYGKLGRAALASRLRKVVSFLREQGATRIVLACNAASTALTDLRIEGVSGVITPTIDHVVKMRPRSLAIVGGRRTIVSRAYANAFRSRGIFVVQRIAQPLSGMIEDGAQHTASFENAVRKILRGTGGADMLVLACTHYPAAMHVFEKIFDGRVVDPAAAVARSISAEKSRAKGAFFTTGDPRAMKRAAWLAWGETLTAKKIAL